MSAWDILKISPTSDVNQIKKAYARLTLEYHPEEHPEEFKRIYEAYQVALKLAAVDRNRRKAYASEAGVSSEDETFREIKLNSQMKEEEEDFYPFEALISKGKAEKEKENRLLVEPAIKALNSLLQVPVMVQDPQVWKKFFKGDLFQKAKHQPLFIKALAEGISKQESLSKQVVTSIYYEYELHLLENKSELGGYSPLFLFLYPVYEKLIRKDKPQENGVKFSFPNSIYLVCLAATYLLWKADEKGLVWSIPVYITIHLIGALWELYRSEEERYQNIRLGFVALLIVMSVAITSILSRIVV